MKHRKIDEVTERLAARSEVEQRREAATNLHDIGRQNRESLEKRGTLSNAADSPLSGNDEAMAALHSAISDPDAHVRLHAVSSAGHLGDGTTVETLEARLHNEQPEIKLAAINALGNIGGLGSIQALTSVIQSETETEETRFAALTELEELTAKKITSGPDRRFNPVEATPEAGGSVERRDFGHIESKLIDSLEKVASDETEDELFRLKANDILSYLRSGVAFE